MLMLIVSISKSGILSNSDVGESAISNIILCLQKNNDQNHVNFKY